MKLTALRDVRMKCFDCCAYQPGEVGRCELRDFPNWPYRRGHRPRKGTPEAAALRVREGVTATDLSVFPLDRCLFPAGSVPGRDTGRTGGR